MIPIRDTAPSHNYPVVTMTLIGINVVVYLLEMAQGPELNRFIHLYGLVPARYTVDRIAAYYTLPQQVFAWLSFMFLHGGFWHLLGNMWTLYIFGDNVEDHLGHLRYLVFYLLCGLVSGISHMVLNMQSPVAVIGASGAIAGVMGAYFLLHPNAKILTLIPIFFIPWFIEIPAFFFLGFWFVLQFINAAGSQAASQSASGGVAWWAHIGGFVGGMVLLKAFARLPSAGMSARLRQATGKKRTTRLQVVRPEASPAELNLYGTIAITPYESFTGTRKLVSIPLGYKKRMLRVTVPPGVNQDQKLRLKGQGKIAPDGKAGDLYLKVNIVMQPAG
ncbi:MAG: FIG056164: rhomboid family serine protease [Olavius algarvensis Delta 4 endosymbiont]|nr:MAG: FIG056164: rhomboid family serine protease [Olavius algarvensis Delta 4 endosymbiont]